MSTEESKKAPANPPPYIIPVGGSIVDEVKVYNLHTPFHPPTSRKEDVPQAMVPEYSPPEPNKYIAETELGRSPGMTTCTSCQLQVMTNVTHKVGPYAWIMCFVFILCGLVLCCCIIPFFVKHFKDVYHSCPRCNQILHIEKKSCC
ncbi:hypothetical protein AAFF_G00080700 [Aldrovandia affinis]|uniref:LITAF domain-containing protein n=1 Tax=Aldrovandia affinis TaxID=143900 RepID=A0AAD7WYF3_9TELE|nr:hypothetical protein AAFF_G00080700 [Aldrovandia affinis]